MSAEESLYTAINGINQLIIDKTATLQPPPLSTIISPRHPQISPIFTDTSTAVHIETSIFHSLLFR